MRRRMRSEDGVALTVAMFTLAVIALFSALIASSAGQLGDTSNEDRDSKRALGAAEAGINTALHRLNNAATPVDNLQCFTDVQVGVLGSATPYPGIEAGVDSQLTVPAGSCPGATGRTGNDGTYTYWITLLNNGQHCDEQYTTATEVSNLLALGVGGISVLRRCITSIGVVNGVQRRLQREIYSEFRLFNGLIGTGGVHARPLANLGTSHVGSNKLVKMEPTSLFGGQVELQDDAPPEEIEATGVWGVTRRSEPWILDPVQVASTGGQNVGCVTLIILPCGASAGLQSGDRVLVPSGYRVTFNAGDHYICQLLVTGGTLNVSGQARVFIDDEDGCGAHGLTIQGGLVNASGIVSNSNLQVYVEGDSAVNISGGSVAQANLTLYAPESNVKIERQNGQLLAPVVKGSISADSIDLMNGVTFVGDALLDITTPFEQIAGKWHAGNWSECPAKPTDTDDPHSGCNG